jgi:holin-like protein
MSTAPRCREDSPPAPAGKAAAAAMPPFNLRTVGRVALGLALIIDCYLAGAFVQARFALLIPGSVLGLFLLLTLLGLRMVPAAWVEEAGRLLLFLLPISFVPIYVGAAEDRALWREWGLVIIGTLTLTVALLWIFTGWLAQRVLRSRSRKEPA